MTDIYNGYRWNVLGGALEPGWFGVVVKLNTRCAHGEGVDIQVQVLGACRNACCCLISSSGKSGHYYIIYYR